MKKTFICGLCRREMPIGERQPNASKCSDVVACRIAQGETISSWPAAKHITLTPEEKQRR